jgi:hypothetical protein
MKVTVVYRGKKYGNPISASRYTVALARLKGRRRMRVSFIYGEPAPGRGVGPGRGEVDRLEVILPRSTAEALSHALQLALTDTESPSLEFRITEAAVRPRRRA